MQSNELILLKLPQAQMGQQFQPVDDQGVGVTAHG
jgi:hypothetical protein